MSKAPNKGLFIGISPELCFNKISYQKAHFAAA